MELVLLAVLLFGALLLIPVGLPGTWLMLALGFGFDLIAPQARIGWLVLAAVAALAATGEALDFFFSAKYTQKYGGSTRGAWGAVVGGLVGALVGVPVPIVGSVVGAFAGAFVGALAVEALSHGDRSRATRAAWGAVLGRAVAAGAKVILGSLIAAILMVAAWS